MIVECQANLIQDDRAAVAASAINNFAGYGVTVVSLFSLVNLATGASVLGAIASAANPVALSACAIGATVKALFLDKRKL